mmetsp:Transcript_34541/g.82868  ORF Transcript_34541/g.82868 Transcript_34541/m.82868 type:complete len:424 (+) Transcript_34541:489-1760(+)
MIPSMLLSGVSVYFHEFSVLVPNSRVTCRIFSHISVKCSMCLTAVRATTSIRIGWLKRGWYWAWMSKYKRAACSSSSSRLKPTCTSALVCRALRNLTLAFRICASRTPSGSCSILVRESPSPSAHVCRQSWPACMVSSWHAIQPFKGWVLFFTMTPSFKPAPMTRASAGASTSVALTTPAMHRKTQEMPWFTSFSLSFESSVMKSFEQFQHACHASTKQLMLLGFILLCKSAGKPLQICNSSQATKDFWEDFLHLERLSASLLTPADPVNMLRPDCTCFMALLPTSTVPGSALSNALTHETTTTSSLLSAPVQSPSRMLPFISDSSLHAWQSNSKSILRGVSVSMASSTFSNSCSLGNCCCVVSPLLSSSSYIRTHGFASVSVTSPFCKMTVWLVRQSRRAHSNMSGPWYLRRLLMSLGEEPK